LSTHLFNEIRLVNTGENVSEVLEADVEELNV